MLLLLIPIYRSAMKIVHWLIMVLIGATVAIAGFLVGWNIRAYKANKDTKI